MLLLIPSLSLFYNFKFGYSHVYLPRFPFIACEIFTCEVDIILKALVEDEEVDNLLSFPY